MRLRLNILNAPKKEAQRTLDPPGGMVGRSADSAIPLLYDSVSRQHVELRHDGQSWWLHNLSQTSPTVVDEKPLESGQAQRLRQGGTLKLGRIFFTYQQEALPTPEQTALPGTPLYEDVTLILSRAAILAPPPGRVPTVSVPPALPPLPTVVRKPGSGVAPASPPMDARRKSAESGPLAPLPTVVRGSGGVVPPPLPPPLAGSESPPTLVLRAHGAAAAASAPAPGAASAPRIVEHQLEPLSVAELVPLEQLEEERARHRRETQRLTAELAQLRHENGVLRDAQAALGAQLDSLRTTPPPLAQTEGANRKQLREKALELLLPFSRSLEQAGAALGQEDSAQARALLGSAALALADLRELFQS